jgi:hypothetical protein
MASVKAKILFEEELRTPLPLIPQLTFKFEYVIYGLMIITMFLFVKKLTATACRKHDQQQEAKFD